VIGPLPYIGGKRRIARRLLPLFPQHTTYVEAFAGGAQVFFHKPRSKVEVLNDLDGEIANFFRVCQRHPQELIRLMRHQPVSRELFLAHKAQLPALLTDIERAARFLYLQRNAWSGLRARPSFHYAVTKPNNHNPLTLPDRLAAAAERLATVQIEQLPYEEILTRYDRPTTLFYLDPPYVGVDLYAHNFTDRQFRDLAQRLEHVQGHFLLSINDCAKARVWFRQFHRLEIAFPYTSLKHGGIFRELLFANFPLPPVLPP
jgi:DNA adenine methylase